MFSPVGRLKVVIKIMDRINRIACEMQKTLADIIQNEMKDPRIPVVTSITKVKLTKDLQFSKAYVSMIASPEEKKIAIDRLNASTGFIRTRLGKKMIIRQIPQILFELDNSVEEGNALTSAIDRILAEEAAKRAAREDTKAEEND